MGAKMKSYSQKHCNQIRFFSTKAYFVTKYKIKSENDKNRNYNLKTTCIALYFKKV